ncbi:hypothetical protein Nepgr_015123 [Nepenthes gracilis]|uniref:Uncharacterized protein n=1 Tax=Nepenthes gracilis TaxID=150966 RepID=A0AAD3SLK8_NEPGR|nr:hypothetical protein Nepgr_015123 [Nepenthes gracilis]
MKLDSFISTLTHGDFFRHLVYKNPQTFREMKSIVRAYAAIEEANDTKRPERTKQPHSFLTAGKRKHHGSDHSHQKQHRTGALERRDYGPINLTPLTDTCSNILKQIRGKKFLK